MADVARKERRIIGSAIEGAVVFVTLEPENHHFLSGPSPGNHLYIGEPTLRDFQRLVRRLGRAGSARDTSTAAASAAVRTGSC